MADKKKKTDDTPAPTMHEAFDAKATLACGNFLAWAHRAGEGKPDRMVLMRKGAQSDRLADGTYREPGFELSIGELPVVIALLEQFKKDTLVKLEAYGIDKEDDE
jgi:hypothetical protein